MEKSQNITENKKFIILMQAAKEDTDLGKELRRVIGLDGPERKECISGGMNLVLAGVPSGCT